MLKKTFFFHRPSFSIDSNSILKSVLILSIQILVKPYPGLGFSKSCKSFFYLVPGLILFLFPSNSQSKTALDNSLFIYSQQNVQTILFALILSHDGCCPFSCSAFLTSKVPYFKSSAISLLLNFSSSPLWLPKVFLFHAYLSVQLSVLFFQKRFFINDAYISSRALY